MSERLSTSECEAAYRLTSPPARLVDPDFGDEALWLLPDGTRVVGRPDAARRYSRHQWRNTGEPPPLPYFEEYLGDPAFEYLVAVPGEGRAPSHREEAADCWRCACEQWRKAVAATDGLKVLIADHNRADRHRKRAQGFELDAEAHEKAHEEEALSDAQHRAASRLEAAAAHWDEAAESWTKAADAESAGKSLEADLLRALARGHEAKAEAHEKAHKEEVQR